MHHRNTVRFLAPLLSITALAAACASSSPAPDGPPLDSPPPVPTTDAPSTAATMSSVPTAQPTAAPSTEPVATSAPTATAAPTAAPTATATATAAPTASAASGPAGANMRVGSMTVDGLTIEDLACRADGLGVLGSMLVAGGIAKKKAALTACAPKGDKPRVEWTAAKGKVGVVNVKASTPAIEACVKKALAGTPAPFEGECAATLVIGK